MTAVFHARATRRAMADDLRARRAVSGWRGTSASARATSPRAVCRRRTASRERVRPPWREGERVRVFRPRRGEWVSGELVVLPALAPPHGWAVSVLYRDERPSLPHLPRPRPAAPLAGGVLFTSPRRRARGPHSLRRWAPGRPDDLVVVRGQVPAALLLGEEADGVAALDEADVLADDGEDVLEQQVRVHGEARGGAPLRPDR